MFYVISDTHFYHPLMRSLPKWPVGYERLILKNLAELRPQDTLIHLGDVSLGHDDTAHREINTVCKAEQRILIRGNHDRRGGSWYLARGWTAVMDGMILNRYGHVILLSHLPEVLPDWISVNVHGHVHSSRPEFIPSERHELVSCERWGFGPVHLQALVESHEKRVAVSSIGAQIIIPSEVRHGGVT